MKENNRTVVVIGGGAAGLMASYYSAINGNTVYLIEKNEKLGKKLYITGKGRCNLTNDCSVGEFLPNVVNNSKFVISALNNFSPEDVMSFFESYGLMLKTERGNRVFPLSDKSSDVIKCLEKACLDVGVIICLNETVLDVTTKDLFVDSLPKKSIDFVLTDKRKLSCDSVIVCTGGLSYKSTGSTGDGYGFAKKFGHTITKCVSGLNGVELCGDFYKKLQGVSLKNVRLIAKRNGKVIFNELGEMLFTHYGISGPLTLSMSSIINRINPSELQVFIDFKPALTDDVLESRILRDFAEFKNKMLKNSLDKLLLKSLIPVIIERSNINENKINNQISKAERQQLVFVLKNFELKIKNLRPIDEAIITSGGVVVKEINPKTMESKLVNGLFFAGEVIDIDALTGGFNIQLAFSTGYVAGNNA